MMLRTSLSHAAPKSGLIFAARCLRFVASLYVCFSILVGTVEASTLKFKTNEGTWLDLDVSPDGRTIVFELLGDLYTLPIEGGKAHRITSGRGYDSQPRYSPDGSRIVFVSDRDGAENVWVARSDGSSPKAVTRGAMNRFLSPEWSPDGKIVVAEGVGLDFNPYPEFGSRMYRLKSYKLVAYDPDTGVSEQLPVVGRSFAGPAFGSDPRHLYVAESSVFDSGVWVASSYRTWSIVVFDRTSGETRPVASNQPDGAFRPIVSPDDRWMVYATRREGRTAFRLHDLRTGEERWLLDDVQRDAQEPLWGYSRDLMPGSAFTPDSNALIFYRNGGVWRLELADGQLTSIPFEVDVSVPFTPAPKFKYRIDDERLDVHHVRGARISPDGSKLVFEALNKLWIKDLPDGKPYRATLSDMDEYQPAWAPDGKHIAFITWRSPAGGAVCRVPVSSTDAAEVPQCLTQEPDYYENPIYSPDGARIVVGRVNRTARLERPTGYIRPLELVWIPATGGKATAIGRSTRATQFSDDAEHIWTSMGGDLRSRPWDDVNEKSELKVLGATDVLISPDRSRLVAIGGPSSLPYLVSMPDESGRSVSLTNALAPEVLPLRSIGAEDPQWTPDGRYVYYSLGGSIFRHDVTTGATRKPERIDIGLSLAADRPRGALLLRGARIVTMREDEVIERGDLLIKDNRIAAIGGEGTLGIANDNVTIIDVQGKTIIPGYVDVHGHIHTPNGVTRSQPWQYLAQLAYGVTTNFDPLAMNDVFGYASLVDSGVMIGPRILSTGPAIRQSENVSGKDHARQTVARYVDHYGTNYIKQYGAGERQVRRWLSEAAREKKVTAVVETFGDTKKIITEALDGYAAMMHGWPTYPIYKDVVELMSTTGMAHVATLGTGIAGPPQFDYLFTRRNYSKDEKLRRFMPLRRIEEKSRRLDQWYADDEFDFERQVESLNKMMDAGVMVGIGSHGDFMGLGFHWEMELHAIGGMPTSRVLRAATINGAKLLGLDEQLGSIEVGKFADLQILDENPLDDIKYSQSIRYVMKNGRLYEGDTLNELWPEQRELRRPE